MLICKVVRQLIREAFNIVLQKYFLEGILLKEKKQQLISSSVQSNMLHSPPGTSVESVNLNITKAKSD